MRKLCLYNDYWCTGFSHCVITSPCIWRCMIDSCDLRGTISIICDIMVKKNDFSKVARTWFETQIWFSKSWFCSAVHTISPIARFMGPAWGPSGADRTQVGPMLAPWTLISGIQRVDIKRKGVLTRKMYNTAHIRGIGFQLFWRGKE